MNLSVYPKHAYEQLEFDKIKALLLQKCKNIAAKNRVEKLQAQDKIDFIEKALQQTQEYKITLETNDYFPNDFNDDLHKQIKLLQISNAALTTQDIQALKKLTLNFRDIINWFKGKNDIFPSLYSIIENIQYEKEIIAIISEVMNDEGTLRDDASKTLLRIRIDLNEKRKEVRRVFENTLRKYNKLGYLADTVESFNNNRRTLAVLVEYKRIVKGILYGYSDSQKTAYIEPEAVVPINNEILELEIEEEKEIQKILIATTQKLSAFKDYFEKYQRTADIYDFIRAKALLAIEMNANLPRLIKHPHIQLINAYHPLLFLQNKTQNKPTIPIQVELNSKNRILMISGPNAGGKTVSMKTIGLLQLMLQAGLLIPADPQSEMGIFKQIMSHIGDTQSIENELSTYSSHLKDMKYFLDFSTGSTLFFIDELGSGSDPDLGGAFAEAIVEKLVKKMAFGVITTHYLNLKTMASRTKGIINGAMAFNEKALQPLYRLVVGKPGSSYTFAIAKRSNMPQDVIDRAKTIANSNHFKLDDILNQTEKQSVILHQKEEKLSQLLHQNEQLKKKYKQLIDKEQIRQQQATLKLQNAIKQEELDYLRETERKFKHIVQEWKKSANKQEVIQAAEAILFQKKQIRHNVAAAKKADKLYQLTGNPPKEGDLVRNKTNHQIGRLLEMDNKKAIVQIGNLPFTVDLKDWVAIISKEELKQNKKA